MAPSTPTGTSASRASKRLLYGLMGVSALLGLLYLQAYVQRPFAPAQPLPFSHDTHTQQEKAGMSCLACHPGAETAAAAGLPAASACLDCHKHILAHDARMLPLHAAADTDSPLYTGEPVLWRRAWALPAYAQFHHGAHAKQYDCARCHPTPGEETPLRMRECLSCHREEKQPTDCTQCHS